MTRAHVIDEDFDGGLTSDGQPGASDKPSDNDPRHQPT
jgi:hypothetical protein